MYIVVSTDNRIPLDIAEGFQVEQWTPNEFFIHASDDEGLEIDEALWYDVSDLTAEIYDGLNAYIEAGVNIIYYRFDDRPVPNFTISQPVKVYQTNIEPEPEVQPITPVQQPVQQPIQQAQPQQAPPVQQPIYPQQPQMDMQMYQQQMYSQQPMYSQPIQQPMMSQVPPVQQPTAFTANKPIPPTLSGDQLMNNMSNMLQYDDYDAASPQGNRKAAPAKVILFGSSKGGTGKTFTCLISAYWYAKNHPTQRIALADFDIIDGQIGITINKLTPTMQDFYKLYQGGRKEFTYLDNCKVRSDHFSPNIDFYLAPSQDIPQITNDNDFWNDLFKQLITNYDVVFFDSGIDYIGKPPISQLYKIADKIVITCNPSINSVKSVIKQFKTLSGQRVNNIFRPGDDILSRVNIVLTRVYDNSAINQIVEQNITKFAPVIATFGNIDSIISQVQWYQQWQLIDSSKEITDQLDKIIDF